MIVDDDGRLVGTVRAHEVLRAIEEVDRVEVDPHDVAPEGAASSAGASGSTAPAGEAGP